MPKPIDLKMRSITLAVAVLPLLFISGSCKRRHRPPEVVSVARAGDPEVATRFTDGFYNVEAGAWRWTAKEFSITLNPPAHAGERGAKLVMNLVIPDPAIQRAQFIELSSSVAGLKLAPQVFAKAGAYTYERDIPPDRLQGKEVRLDFAVDHTIPPTKTDLRTLGIIVSQIGLITK